jgi:hypothetical protein
VAERQSEFDELKAKYSKALSLNESLKVSICVHFASTEV